jgi:Protein of unknown function (DUF3311)
MEVEVTEPDRTDRERELAPDRARPLPPGVLAAAGVLILVPIVALMLVGTYANATPKLWGFPFFYWYQLLWVFITAGCTYLAYLLVHNARRGGDR